MAEPLVSICIPTFNGEAFLEECLLSCLRQSFSDYEIIICDDGSGDATISIIDKFKDDRIRLFRNQQNLGLVGNWNRCLELARGQWIKFVFQDDYISPNCLETFVKAIDERTQLLVSKRHFILPHNADPGIVDYYTRQVRTLENTVSVPQTEFSPAQVSKIAVENICMNFIGEPSLIFFRKSVAGELGLFNNNLKQICDLEFALKVGAKYGLKYIPKELCSFRIHTRSTTSSNVAKNYFQLHYIEPALFSYFLLYADNFNAFRSHLGVFQKLKLKLYFKVKTYKAARVNTMEQRAHPVFEEGSSPFKEIIENKDGNLLVKIVSRFLG